MQAASQPALANLQDIITPPPVGVWPLAYGYYLLALLVLMLIAALFIYIKRRGKLLAAKREALTLLSKVTSEAPQLPLAVNSLLKRSAMSYLPREQVASLQGDAWYAWLRAQVPSMDPMLPSLLEKRFQADKLSPSEATQLLDGAKAWLQQALPLKAGKEASCSH
ncbi:DUF4381 domain-containing protein [Shewanella aegiceratis]|uniref:DUF4381 domain-containing protein n=1 Tax=Shewanella aegiceratis TaxID=2864203 RepID=UPI001C655431|nr:DUF4381 domain-containing protein [Shewanella aegiceratis]QYJ81127.1 DUF4381 domain-containing protein [Shewanella aegiceratis]